MAKADSRKNKKADPQKRGPALGVFGRGGLSRSSRRLRSGNVAEAAFLHDPPFRVRATGYDPAAAAADRARVTHALAQGVFTTEATDRLALPLRVVADFGDPSVATHVGVATVAGANAATAGKFTARSIAPPPGIRVTKPWLSSTALSVTGPALTGTLTVVRTLELAGRLDLPLSARVTNAGL